MARVRAAEYDDKRDAILDRAAELFAVNGFARTSMNAISEACGASKAALYHYYVGKDALLFDILDSHIRFLLETVEEIAATEPDPRKRLYRLTEPPSPMAMATMASRSLSQPMSRVIALLPKTWISGALTRVGQSRRKLK